MFGKLFSIATISFYLLTNVFAQTSILSNFSGTSLNNKVFLKWTISAGNTCNGIQLFRSIDSLNFIEIGDIQGVCGSLSEPKGYSFTDLNPVLNFKNYYRLDLGGIETSLPIAVNVIDFADNNYYLTQNPITTTAKVVTYNPTFETLNLTIFLPNGAIAQQLTTTADFFTIDAMKFATGSYFFTISSEKNERPIQGKFIVTR